MYRVPEPEQFKEKNMDNKLMTFGKYKHKPIAEVPDWYLHWCAKQDWCPAYIAVELDRRGTKYMQMPVKTRRKLKQHLKNTGQWKWKKAKSSGSVIVGKEYEWLRAEWEDAGGDSSECPFGEDYAGPILLWENDEWIIYVNVQHGKSNLLSTE